MGRTAYWKLAELKDSEPALNERHAERTHQRLPFGNWALLRKNQPFFLEKISKKIALRRHFSVRFFRPIAITYIEAHPRGSTKEKLRRRISSAFRAAAEQNSQRYLRRRFQACRRQFHNPNSVAALLIVLRHDEI
jgi:hypothetical protein